MHCLAINLDNKLPDQRQDYPLSDNKLPDQRQDYPWSPFFSMLLWVVPTA